MDRFGETLFCLSHTSFFSILKWISLCFSLSALAQTVKNAYNAGDPGLIPRSGRSLGEGNGKPLQYSCLENSMTDHEIAKSGT